MARVELSAVAPPTLPEAGGGYRGVSVSSDAELETLPDGCGPPLLKRFTLSESFAVSAALVICVNVMVMVVQADYPHWKVACSGPDSCLDMWLVVNGIFLAFYMFELALRFLTFGSTGFFCHPEDWTWNWFDFLIVTSGVIDMLMKLVLSSSHAAGKLVVVIRVMRILRVLRVLRLFRQFKKLRLLMRGLMESTTGVFWIFVMNLAVLFISAIFVTSIIGQNAQLWEDPEAINKYFGSVGKSMFTLFQFMTLDDWNSVDTMVAKVMPWMQAFFLPFVVLAAFVILSLLTGVMADHMNHVREAEEEDSRKGNPQEQFASWCEAFRREDDDEDPRIGKDEFASIFSNRKLAWQLTADLVELTSAEAAEVFESFPLGADGRLSWEEFSRGLEAYQTALSAKDIILLRHRASLLHRQILRREEDLQLRQSKQPSAANTEHLDLIEGKLERLHERLGGFDRMLSQLKHLVREQDEDEDA